MVSFHLYSSVGHSLVGRIKISIIERVGSDEAKIRSVISRGDQLSGKSLNSFVTVPRAKSGLFLTAVRMVKTSSGVAWEEFMSLAPVASAGPEPRKVDTGI